MVPAEEEPELLAAASAGRHLPIAEAVNMLETLSLGDF